ncbi:MAG: ParB/RepB/Spo0J family partition protein [bacterium]
MEDEIQSIPLDRIKPGIHQPRHRFDLEKIQELADSIRQNGIVQPIFVRPGSSGFELIAGERRWRAAQLAGLTHIPAIVRKIDDKKALELSLVENLQRNDLNPVEIAKGYSMLTNEYGMTQEDISRVVGKNRATVANMIRLLKLPKRVLEMLEQETISMGHAKVLLSLENQNQMITYAEKATKQEWSVRELERRLKVLKAPERKKISKSRGNADLEAAIDLLRTKYLTKIRCFPIKKGGGKIVFEYYNDDDLIRLIALMGE